MELRSLNVGPDTVTFDGEIVVIQARREIPDWKVREFHRHAIYFQGRKYFLRNRGKAGPPFAFEYKLAPWPEDLHEQSIHSFIYDEESVTARDATAGREQRRHAAWCLLVPLYPFLGFCWSGFKERVLRPIGFLPQSITSASTVLTLGAVLVDGIMFGYLGGGVVVWTWGRRTVFGLADWCDVALIILLFLDCIIRYDQVLRHRDVPDGFLEWAFWFLKPKNKPPQ